MTHPYPTDDAPEGSDNLVAPRKKRDKCLESRVLRAAAPPHPRSATRPYMSQEPPAPVRSRRFAGVTLTQSDGGGADGSCSAGIARRLATRR